MDGDTACYDDYGLGEYLAGRQGDYRLALALKRPSDDGGHHSGESPFVAIEDPGCGGTAFVGRLQSIDGVEQRPVVVKILKNNASPFIPTANNRDRARAFLDGYQDLCQIAKTGGVGVARPVPLALARDAAGELAYLLPLFYCGHRHLYFHPPCPQCGAPLQDCQDEKLLQDSGLPSFAHSSQRYLYCAACAGNPDQEGPRFFTEYANGEQSPHVGDRWALIEAFARLASAGDRAPQAGFPCAGCENATACYPPGQPSKGAARALLSPLSFHQCHAYVQEYLPLRYDQLCDVLGGKAEQGVDQHASVEPFAGYMYRDDAQGGLASEVLLTKLAVFEEICRSVRAVHGTLQRPHMGLRPEVIRFALGDGARLTPRFWDFKLGLSGLDSLCRARSSQGHADAPSAYAIFQGVSADYAHPRLVQGPYTRIWQGTLAVTDVAVAGEDNVATIAAVFASPEITGVLGAQDVIELQGAEAAGVAGSTMRFRVLSSEAGRYVLQSVPAVLSSAEVACWREHGGAGRPVTVRVLSDFGAEWDLYSLGMLLFRMLLVNQTQNMATVRKHCVAIGEYLQHTFAMGRQDVTATQMREQVEQRLADDFSAPLFAMGNLFHEPREIKPLAVFEQAWRRLLTMGFRLFTPLSGFSYLEPGNSSDAARWQVLEQVVRELQALRVEMRRALFVETPASDEDIHGILTELLGDPHWLDQFAPVARTSQKVPLVAPAAVPPAAREIATPPPPPQAQPDSVDETLILRRGAPALETPTQVAPSPAAVEVAPKVQPEEEQDLEATMILSREAAAQWQTRAHDTQPEPAARDDRPAAAVPPAQETAAEKLDLEATMILSRETATQWEARARDMRPEPTDVNNPAVAPPQTQVEEDLDATVILPAPNRRVDK